MKKKFKEINREEQHSEHYLCKIQREHNINKTKTERK